MNDTSLRRVLSARDLILYGIVLITPIAPVPIYGVAQELSRGHLILSLMLAGVAMMLTAFSYGRMANIHPSAGSAYAYVGHGLNPSLGFIAGWTMTLDYIVLPIVAIIQASLAIHRLVPSISYQIWATVFAALITFLNLRGMKTTARTNMVALLVMGIIITAFFVCAVQYLSATDGARGLLSLRPLYDPETFDMRAVATATSFAALTYIGFDGVTTLAEDVRNPTRNVPLASVSICLFTTIFSCVLVYFAQLIYPDYHSFPNIETAFMDVTRRVGGNSLFHALGIVIIISSLAAALGGVVAAARVLFAMGRDHALPSQIFGQLDVSGNPTRNILLLAVIIWAGSLALSLEHAGQLLNFGAFLGFMGVHLAALRQFYFRQERSKRRLSIEALIPITGFLICFAIWLTLPTLSKLIGGAWLLLGLTYHAWRMRRLPTRDA